MANVANLHNDYARLLGFFDRIPKAVLAAIAVSYAARLNEDGLELAEWEVAREWRTLHENGIVRQPVPADVRARLFRT